MKKILNTVLLLLLLSYNPSPAQDAVHQSKSTYPFELSTDGGQFSIQAFLDGKPLYPKYYKFFKKYGYEGNGPCWEGHIRQILEKKDPTLLLHLRFDVEGGAFLAYANSRQTQQRFLEILCPIFSNLDSLAVWVKRADRSRIDD